MFIIDIKCAFEPLHLWWIILKTWNKACPYHPSYIGHTDSDISGFVAVVMKQSLFIQFSDFTTVEYISTNPFFFTVD